MVAEHRAYAIGGTSLWEFWKFYKDSSGRWHATSGHKYSPASQAPGFKHP